MTRNLYLVAYDVADPARLHRVGRCVNSYRVAGQKSVPEVWLTQPELQQLQKDLLQLLNPNQDRLQLVALDPRLQLHCLGRAITFSTPAFFVL